MSYNINQEVFVHNLHGSMDGIVEAKIVGIEKHNDTYLYEIELLDGRSHSMIFKNVMDEDIYRTRESAKAELDLFVKAWQIAMEKGISLAEAYKIS